MHQRKHSLAHTDFRDQMTANGTWQHLKFDVDPTDFNFTTNQTVQFRFGLSFFQSGEFGGATGYPEIDPYNNETVIQSPNQTVYFSGVNLYLQTRVHPSDVNLSITIENELTSIPDENWSNGHATWVGTFPAISMVVQSTLIIQFDTNWSDCVLDWKLEVNATAASWVTTQPVDPAIGIGGNYRGISYTTTPSQPVIWTYFLYSQIPRQWHDNYQIWMKISRDWKILSVKTPNFIEIVQSIIGGNDGDSRFGIRAEKHHGERILDHCGKLTKL